MSAWPQKVSYDKGVPALSSENLSPLERAVLAILGAGLAPASVAHDPSFRIDVLAAVILARIESKPDSSYLHAPGEATPEFQARTRDAIYDLTDKQILSTGGPPISGFVDLEGQQRVLADRGTAIHFDQHPAVFDRYLAGRCLDELLRDPKVYAFIMGKYAESSEVWQRVYEQYK
jgi:hypothetical protein